jgi:small ligand-binding sensory domain FIST
MPAGDKKMAEQSRKIEIEKGSVENGRFKSAFAAVMGERGDWSLTAASCLEAMGALPEGANLGFLYVTDVLADDISAIHGYLQEHTGISHWVGTLGNGIVASGVEIYGQSAISILVMALPDDDFRLFEPIVDSLDDFRAKHGEWIDRHHPILGVVHGDPHNRDIAEIIEDISEETSTFLVGGLTSSRGKAVQVSDSVDEGGLSGVLFAPDQPAITGLTQGCTPIGPRHRVTEGEDNIIKKIDDRDAVDVLREDVGELLSRDLRRIGGYIYVSFPIAASDTGDYLVRNLIGVDLSRGWIQVGELVSPGMALSFCRRDNDSALKDLKRMLSDVSRRAEAPPKAALYFSCIARGQHLFGPQSEEVKEIKAQFGDIPLAGFFANGEISNNRLYGYTGVLTLLF